MAASSRSHPRRHQNCFFLERFWIASKIRSLNTIDSTVPMNVNTVWCVPLSRCWCSVFLLSCSILTGRIVPEETIHNSPESALTAGSKVWAQDSSGTDGRLDYSKKQVKMMDMMICWWFFVVFFWVLACLRHIGAEYDYGPSIYTVNDQYIKPVTAEAGKMSWALMMHPLGLDCDLLLGRLEELHTDTVIYYVSLLTL